MIYKLELDFQFWRFFTFGLFAVAVAVGIAASSGDGSPIWGNIFIGFAVAFAFSIIMFLKNYKALRKKLK